MLCKKSIYVAYTGGTIGMQRSEHGYIPVSGHLQRQLALMPEFHRPEMPDFTIHEYDPLMDSSDMTPEDWQHIADDIRALRRVRRLCDPARYRHHGVYRLGAVVHAGESGQTGYCDRVTNPLAELRSDGQINLLNALYVAANYPINEVALFFNNRLYRGNRTTKAHADGLTPSPRPTWRRCWKPGSIFVVSVRRLRRRYRRADCASHHAAADWRGDDLSGHFRRRGA
jgi:L-asparaginase